MKPYGDISAIILSAGFSSRMGDSKPLLALGKKTVLEQTIDIFQRAGITDIRVVVGHRYTELLPLIEKAGAGAVINPNYKAGMLSSIKAGMKTLPESQKAFFILPVDIPLVRNHSVIDLLNAWKNGNKEILYPSFFDERGHPPLISIGLKDKILSWNGDGGLRAFLLQYEDLAADIPVADEFILFDMDTPQDYKTAIRFAEEYHIPTYRECMAMMTRKFHLKQSLLDHCFTVARVAVHLAHYLNVSGCEINPELVQAAGLLHDLLRDEPDHAKAAAGLLRRMGFIEVADIVECHMEIRIDDGTPLHAREVVYLADKVVKGNRLVPLAQRFGSKLAGFTDNPAAALSLENKFQNTLKIKDRFEAKTGKSLDAVLREIVPTFNKTGAG